MPLLSWVYIKTTSIPLDKQCEKLPGVFFNYSAHFEDVNTLKTFLTPSFALQPTLKSGELD